MVRQFYESPMNRIRSELAQRIPKEYWPRRNISREEISDLLFFHNDATLKEIASYLSIDISDERGGYPKRDAVSIYAIDIDTRDVVQRFTSITNAYRALFIRMCGYKTYCFTNIIEKQLAFSLNGRYIILSLTEHIEGDIHPILVHSMNFPRFKKFLYDIRFDFVTPNTSINTIRQYFGFPQNTRLKTIVEHFHFPWGKVTSGGFNDKVLVRIVTPTSVSNEMGMCEVGRELDIAHNYVREYISRSVFFRYEGSSRDSFLIYA